MLFWQHPLVKNIGPDQFCGLFKTTPLSAAALIVVSAFLSFALIGNIPLIEVLIWWGITTASAFYSLYRWHKNKLRQPSKISRRGIAKLMITAFIFALPWAYALANYLGNLPHGAELILIAVSSGMAASGSIQLSRIYPGALVYLATITVAGALKCFYLNTPEYIMLGVLILTYGFFLKQLVKNTACMSIDRSRAVRSLEKQIAEMNNTKSDLQRFAMEDSLTCLPNRREFHTQLSTSINEAKRQDSTVSLMVCDLDHFKNINDISGHAAGDSMLIEIAKRLKTCCREHDLVARIGGDEFAIIAKHHKSPKDTVDFTQRLLDEINKPIKIDGTSVVPGMSVGISMFPYDAHDDHSILTHADLALQRGKANGRGGYSFFDQKMKSQLSCDEAMETDLRLALVENEFELFYQPKVCIRTGEHRGFEALLRWRRADGTLVPPGDFFPVAEDRGLMSYISDFVIEQALTDIRFWKDQGLNSGKISINIHPVQIKDEHRMKRLVRDVERSGINPSDIYLEITEGCIIGRGTENIPEMLEYLRNKGFRISLDDFGTGFASLSHLKDLPVDELKFDRSFICELLSKAANRSIVHAMVKLATSLDVTTVAEGVETREQHNVLMAIGCTLGQGYLYNRPLDLEAATGLLINQQKSTRDRIVLKSSPVSQKILAQSPKLSQSA